MEDLYAQIDLRNRQPQAQPDALRSDLYTRALWTLGDWTFKTPTLYQDLAPLQAEGLIFTPDGSQAQLHWTLLQFQTFPVRPDQTLYNDEQGIVLSKRILREAPPIHIRFTGISRTRFGIFLNGYPNYNINGLRDEFRQACSGEMIEPHPQDIFHATLFRFTKEPSQMALDLLDSLVQKYRGITIATMRPTTWEFGYGTWTQKVGERLVKDSWPAKPAHWILHRGLKDGPDSALENREELLLERIQEGWEVEVDLWLKEGSFWLGHDGPERPLKDRRLLTNEKVWVHCKNLEMVAYMVEQRPGAPFFSHDRDEAVLTSNGLIWCYPGFQAGPNSIVVMPERVPEFRIDYERIRGICTDYKEPVNSLDSQSI